MDDSISRQAAIDFIDAGHLCDPNELRWSDNDVVNFLKKRPSAEPEIIRCKECKHWMREKLEGFELPYGDCESPDILDCIRGNAYDVIAFQTNEDFYCGFAMTEDSEVEE